MGERSVLEGYGKVRSPWEVGRQAASFSRVLRPPVTNSDLGGNGQQSFHARGGRRQNWGPQPSRGQPRASRETADTVLPHPGVSQAPVRVSR
jgi:hypothetical protein